MPIHILPPLENAQNHRFISTADGPSHRSGSKVPGSSKPVVLRCKIHGDIPTTVPGGMVYPSIAVVMLAERGSVLGNGAYSLSVSFMTAWRYAHWSATTLCEMPCSFNDVSGMARTSSLSVFWNLWFSGSDRAQMRNMRVSLVVSMPARKWSAHSDATCISFNPLLHSDSWYFHRWARIE